MVSRVSQFVRMPSREEAVAVLWSLVFVAFTTLVLAGVERVIDLESVTSLYLVPVLIAATRWGALPAAVAAAAGVMASAFFFYPPLFDWRISDPQQTLDLVLFVIVAIVTGRLATNLRNAKLRAEAETLRDALVDSVSHELRTPLASIVGAASVLAKSPEVARDTRLAALSRVIRDEAHRLDQHIQNLLDATRISSESVRPQLDWVDPADILNEAVKNKRALLSEHRIAMRIGGDLPLVRTDATLAGRAFAQFVENAAKYSPAGSVIDISAAVEGGDVRIAVHDQGAGLSEEEQQKIWTRFYRGARHARSSPGSGLGLWIAHALVAACGGRVEARSAGTGMGSIFAIRLPITAAAPPPAEEGQDGHDE
jgi:K+-sensing histidine kinase KdpD